VLVVWRRRRQEQTNNREREETSKVAEKARVKKRIDPGYVKFIRPFVASLLLLRCSRCSLAAATAAPWPRDSAQITRSAIDRGAE